MAGDGDEAYVHGLHALTAECGLSDHVALLGFVLAVPPAWYGMQRWLEGFAYRIDLGPLVFAGAGALALVVALAATGWQAVQAARANPAEALRDE